MLISNRIKTLSCILFSTFLFNISSVEAKDFYYKFNNRESKINFDISTNIHPVKAVAEKFKGYMNIKSADEKNIDSVEGLLEIDATSIITHIALCDTRMQKETLSTDKYPKISFKVNKVILVSNKIETDNTIFIKLVGPLSIRDVSKKVEIPVKVTILPDKSSAMVEGKYNLNFSDFNVPDPSVLIAKVEPILSLSFKLKVY